jgi:hypothetical protein
MVKAIARVALYLLESIMGPSDIAAVADQIREESKRYQV